MSTPTFLVQPQDDGTASQNSSASTVPSANRLDAAATDNRTANVETNEQHYNAAYRCVTAATVVAQLRDFNSFLADATATDTSWHGLYHGDFRQRLVGRKVIELGCGSGMNALIMALLGAQVIAIDISSESKRIINEAADQLGLTRQNIEAVTGDLSEVPLPPHSFDLVVGKAFLHHLTPELECEYLRRTARLLQPEGEARFFEPAVNNRGLDWLRWNLPILGRPSRMSRRAFAEWKALDPHPERDNSTEGFLDRARPYFADCEVVHLGSVERFHRLLPSGRCNRAFRRWAHRIEPRLPVRLRHEFARAQLLIYRHPRVEAFS